MTCSHWLDVPLKMRAAALDFPNGPAEEDEIPDMVYCELDRHPYGQHIALLRDLDVARDGGAVWLTWAGWGRDIDVQRFGYCPSSSPGRDDACWLPSDHRGGHTWERYE
ncbi:hypothetical protein E0L36_19040 [Streptomyces sp. AJS327]|uniref:hypothetical protein n=1 Tax=Streptomyces sp. AJS327 TaxID=2545265 RepID=UPI0015DDC88E|nr:hypothetical protein [Streptomyces sp. AJS327]MBA0052892.1 hypothetical protein [Streptomyces sp. AJS327]